MRVGGPDIASGFGPAPGALAAKLTRGDPLVINGVSYTFEREISKSTGEAEIYLLLQNGQSCVFKFYYPNFKPKEAILAPLKQLRHEDIINVIDYGYHHDRFFEIMEYAKGGTLELYLPIRDLQRLRKIVAETVNAFKFCHDRGIVHRDIKPENIYCKNADGTDFVIGDFGISSALDAGITRHLTSQNLTAGYAAPEMYGFGGKVYIGREVDYYALGITLIHLWQGKSPFDGLTIHAIANLTNAGAINVPGDVPEALKTLIRGLITIDFAKRWGHDEVRRWLNGEDVPVHFHVKEITYPPFQFDSSQKAPTPVALARLLKGSPDRGKKLLYSGKISAWVNVFDQALAAELDRIVEDEYPKSQDAGLQKAIYVLDPDEPFTQVNRECRTAKELATELEDQFDFYLGQLTNPNYSIYLYLEAHEEKKEADAFRAYFRTFSAKKALNTIILELAGRASVSIVGTVFTTPEAVLQARNRPDVVNMLKDRESKLSLWMEGAASKSVNAQLDAWRALKICDATTLAYVSEKGDGIPQLGLSKNAFSFADLKSRSTASDSFEVRNTGGGSLTGSITTNKNWLRLAQTQIDASRKLQTISFSIDTTGLPFGATDTAAIEVQSNVGAESVSIAIAIEQGVRAAARFRNAMTLGAGAAGALLGFAIHKVSALAGTADPSGLAGLAAVAGIAIEAGVAAKRSGRSSLWTGLGTLVCGMLVFAYLNAFFPLTYSACSWALLFMVLAYGTAPLILKRMQMVKSRKVVPVGVAAGAVALSTAMVLGDMQISKRIPPDLGRHMSGNSVPSGGRRIAPGEPAGAGWMASVVQQIVGRVQGEFSQSAQPGAAQRGDKTATPGAARPQVLPGNTGASPGRNSPSLETGTTSEEQQRKSAEAAAAAEAARTAQVDQERLRAQQVDEARKNKELEQQRKSAEAAEVARAAQVERERLRAQQVEEARQKSELRAAANEEYKSAVSAAQQDYQAAVTAAQHKHQQQQSAAQQAFQQETSALQAAMQRDLAVAQSAMQLVQRSTHNAIALSVARDAYQQSVANSKMKHDSAYADAKGRYQLATSAAREELQAANRDAQEARGKRTEAARAQMR